MSIQVFSPIMTNFPYEESKKMYEEYKVLIGDDQDFDDVITNSMYFAFKHEGKLLGGIYFYRKDSRTFVNVFSGRGQYKLNNECFKWALKGFREPIYAHTIHRYVKLRIKRLGFKEIDTNLYKYERRD